MHEFEVFLLTSPKQKNSLVLIYTTNSYLHNMLILLGPTLVLQYFWVNWTKKLNPGRIWT